MPGIIEFPQVVEEAIDTYRAVFANEPQRRHFGEYLTGLMLAERKSVSGINREFAQTTDQSCLNRWLTQAEWDVKKLNRLRLTQLQADATTRYTKHGVIAMDNVLIDHTGELIEDVGWLWDHASHRHVVAHDYLIANYVCASGQHYPLEFRRFRKQAQCDTSGEAFKNHTTLCLELVDWVIAEAIPGDFAFDSSFTNSEILNHIDECQRGYVGDLKSNRRLVVAGRAVKASEWVKGLTPAVRTKTQVDGKVQWFYTKTIRLPGVTHKVRILVLWKHRTDPDPVKLLVCNRTYWEAHRLLKTYRKRWTGTETFHRDGKQELGMGDCQLRSGEGQTRHLYLVFVAYSALMRQLKHARAEEWAFTKLMTIGQACRALLRHTLGKTVSWVVRQALRGYSDREIIAHLALL